MKASAIAKFIEGLQTPFIVRRRRRSRTGRISPWGVGISLYKKWEFFSGSELGKNLGLLDVNLDHILRPREGHVSVVLQLHTLLHIFGSRTKKQIGT